MNRSRRVRTMLLPFTLLLLLLLSSTPTDGQTRPCGTMQSYFTTNSRIVGGELASDFAWPWQVYITVRGSFTCGGTLIDRRHVLTAAHCVLGNSKNTNDYLIRVGAHNMAKQGYYTGTFYRVSAIFVNERYTNAVYGYDITIMRLAYSVDLSDTVNVVCLPPAGFDVPNYTPVVITGFGLTGEGGSLPYTLQQAVIELLPTCKQVYSFDSNSQLCAGLTRGGKDTCQGDSGGPLVYQPRRSDQWYIIGITSYGSGCARINYPGVYTRVTGYLDWIRAIISQI